MLDHIFLTVSNVDRSIDFYTAALAPLGIASRVDYDGKNGPAGHPDLKGFGANGRISSGFDRASLMHKALTLALLRTVGKR